MDSQRWKQVDEVLQSVLDLPAEQREPFLRNACAGDEALEREVRSLLTSERQGARFLERPAIEVAAKAMARQESEEAQDRADTLIGQTVSHYRVVAKLGGGGMGVVYEGEDMRLGRRVALKFLPENLARDQRALQRFEREARAASALNHPSICTIYEVEEHAQQPVIVMELLEGQSLKDRMRTGPIPLDELLDLGIQTSDALAAAHAKGIIHRDIKPANLFVVSGDRVKILDFGLAKTMPSHLPPSNLDEESLTVEGMIPGTTAYMSPEQVRGEEIDARSDLFSLGVVLYEMACGKRPFAGKNRVLLMNAILNQKPVPPTDANPELPSAIDAITGKALEKDRQQRYQHARDIHTDLERLKRERDSGRPALPAVGAIHTREEYPQRRIKAAGMVGFALMVLLGIGVWLYLLRGRGEDKPIDSVAVLPFLNAGNDPNTEYLSDGITESLIGALSHLSSLRVMARDTVFSYKGQQVDPRKAGRDLKVDAVVTGKVSERADTLIVEADLVKVADGQELWGERYNRNMGDLLGVQDEITTEISRKLRLRLSGEDAMRLHKASTANSEAYRLYRKGRYFASKATKEDLDKGMAFFNQAIAMDPTYALAYEGLSYYYGWTDDLLLAPRDAMPKAKEAAKKALELDDGLPQAHVDLATVLAQYEWDWTAAEQEYRRSIQLDPNYAAAHTFLGYLLVSEGRFEEGIQEDRRAVELDPLSPEANWFLGWMLYSARRYEEAIDQLRKTIDLDPNFFLAHTVLGVAYEQKGRMPAAISELEKGVRLGECNQSLGELGRAYAVVGKRREAQQLAGRLIGEWKRSHVGAYDIAIIETGLGEKDQAIAWLESAYQDRTFFMDNLKVEPELDTLRSDPRFKDLLRRMNFPP